MTTLSKSLIAALCIFTAPLQAHEFWIQPEAYVVPSGGQVEATFRNGEMFEGSSLSYIPSRSERFDMVQGGVVAPIPARMGASPAVALDEVSDGLLTLIHETGDQSLTYKEWAKWVKFTDHKDFAFAQEGHRVRGLPDEGFRESYRRFAKALVGVGTADGADAARGLRAEFVLGANPYTDDVAGGLPVQVLFDGAPKADAQIEMFERAPDGSVAVTLHRADADGRAMVPVKPGHEYLLDSVTLLPLEPEAENDPVWYTLWAALTFAVPEG